MMCRWQTRSWTWRSQRYGHECESRHYDSSSACFHINLQRTVEVYQCDWGCACHVRVNVFFSSCTLFWVGLVCTFSSVIGCCSFDFKSNLVAMMYHRNIWWTQEVWRCLSKAGCLRKVVQRGSFSFAMVMQILSHFSLKVSTAACTMVLASYAKILELLIFAMYLLHINLEITDPVSVP